MTTSPETTEDGIESYRLRLRRWLRENSPDPRSLRWTQAGGLDAARAWQRRLHEAGYLALSWPAEHGGPGAGLLEQAVFTEEFARARAPRPIGMIGIDILGPTLIVHGTDAQRAQHLGPILRAENLWCQGFSEPDAGSDLASLTTRGEVDGDDLVITGQKIWTSLGTISDWCFLLVRTGPGTRGRRGISYVLCEMSNPGIEVRPLRNAAGGRHFSELFLDEVRVPLSNVVGGLHQGWAIARTSLDSERSGLAGVIDLERSLGELASMLTTAGHRVGSPPVDGVVSELGSLAMDVEALRWWGRRTLSDQIHGVDPGDRSALGKLASTTLRQAVAKLGLEVCGVDGHLGGGSSSAHRWQVNYLDSLGYTIGGGTSEIMLNVVADRLLGLPTDA